MLALLKKIFIISLHLFYLAWILYILYEAGTLPTDKLLYHFVAMAFYGGILIRGTAFTVKKDYEKAAIRKR